MITSPYIQKEANFDACFLLSLWPCVRTTPRVSSRPRSSQVPDFLVEGKIDVSTCSIVRPFTGELTVVRSEAPVKSIELQLVRVETCGCLEGYAKDVSRPSSTFPAQTKETSLDTLLTERRFPYLFLCLPLISPFSCSFFSSVTFPLPPSFRPPLLRLLLVSPRFSFCFSFSFSFSSPFFPNPWQCANRQSLAYGYTLKTIPTLDTTFK